MSLQIVQNQQLKPIGDKVPIDTTLSSSSENAISNKAVTEEINRIKLEISTKTQTYSITSTSQSAGYYYQNLSVPSEIGSINKIYGCMLVDHSGVGAVVSVSVDNVNSIIQARYTQAPNNGSITLNFLYDAN